MFEAKFIYPEYGYMYLNTENPQVTLHVTNNSANEEKAVLNGTACDYYDECILNINEEYTFKAKEQKEFVFNIPCKKKGYYKVEINVVPEHSEHINKVTGLGYTVHHDRSLIPESCFGISGNLCTPELHYPILSRMGVRYIRQGNPDKFRRLQKNMVYSYLFSAKATIFTTVIIGTVLLFATHRIGTILRIIMKK